MGDSNPDQSPNNETVLLIAVPEAEPVVGRWRQRFDSSASDGVPAHVTVVAPFLDVDRLDAGTLEDLRALFAAHDAFDLRFDRFGRFPTVLYLAPDPADPLVALTEAVVARWPEAPPYEGKFDEVTPHLTIASDQTPEANAEAEADISGHLPIVAHVSSVQLLTFDGERWQVRETFPLRG